MESSVEKDAIIRERLTREFRAHTSGVDPEHMAFVAERVVHALMAQAWDEGVEHIYEGTTHGYARIIEGNPYRDLPPGGETLTLKPATNAR